MYEWALHYKKKCKNAKKHERPKQMKKKKDEYKDNPNDNYWEVNRRKGPRKKERHSETQKPKEKAVIAQGTKLSQM